MLIEEKGAGMETAETRKEWRTSDGKCKVTMKENTIEGTFYLVTDGGMVYNFRSGWRAFETGKKLIEEWEIKNWDIEDELGLKDLEFCD